MPPGYVRDQQQITTKGPELIDVHPMGMKAAKYSKLLANAQLVKEKKHVQMLERKVKTQFDVMNFCSRLSLVMLIQSKPKGGVVRYDEGSRSYGGDGG
jgi:hypothetical protein